MGPRIFEYLNLLLPSFSFGVKKKGIHKENHDVGTIGDLFFFLEGNVSG